MNREPLFPPSNAITRLPFNGESPQKDVAKGRAKEHCAAPKWSAKKLKGKCEIKKL
jgi:hypothetical protein